MWAGWIHAVLGLEPRLGFFFFMLAGLPIEQQPYPSLRVVSRGLLFLSQEDPIFLVGVFLYLESL